MKATNFLAVSIIALALTACGNDNDPQPENRPVPASLSAGIGRMDMPQSRAAGTAWAPNDAIGITATAGSAVLYTNIHYHTPAGDGNFVATPGPDGKDNNIYFQNTDPVAFSAYYPYYGDNGTAPDTDGILTRTLSAADQAADKQPDIDYLYATATGSSASPAVSLMFAHRMSRIVLNFKPGAGIDFPAEGFDFTLKGLKMEGSFNTTNGNALASATATPQDISLKVSTPTAVGAVPAASLILFPQSTPTAELTVKINNVDYNASLNIATNGLAPGSSYTYNVTVNKTSITISAPNIGNWNEEGEDNVDVWNP